MLPYDFNYHIMIIEIDESWQFDFFKAMLYSAAFGNINIVIIKMDGYELLRISYVFSTYKSGIQILIHNYTKGVTYKTLNTPFCLEKCVLLHRSSEAVKNNYKVKNIKSLLKLDDGIIL